MRYMKTVNKGKTKLFYAHLFIILSFCLSINSSTLYSQAKNAPANVATALILKLITFEKKICTSNNEITIYVLDAADVAKVFRESIGQTFGKAVLKSVNAGTELPENIPTILFIGNALRVKEAIDYTRKHNILSTTNLSGLVARGVTFGIELGKDNKPKIFLNPTASIEEGMDWNPVIFKVVKIVK